MRRATNGQLVASVNSQLSYSGRGEVAPTHCFTCCGQAALLQLLLDVLSHLLGDPDEEDGLKVILRRWEEQGRHRQPCPLCQHLALGQCNFYDAESDGRQRMEQMGHL